MGFLRQIKEAIGNAISYDQGVDAGEEWAANGGDSVDETMLHQIHVSRGIETASWPHFNKGFVDVVGSKDKED